MRNHGAAWLALAGTLTLAACGSEPAPAPSATPASAAAPTTVADMPSSLPEPTATPLAVASQDSTPPPAIYAPQDECTAKPGWPAFRKALDTAIASRNADALAALASADIALDYGGGSGTAELKKRLADPDGPLWQELDDILPLGCAVEGGLAAMPWVFWNVPDTIDSYSAMLVVGSDAQLTAKPGGKQQAPVGWRIVGIDPLKFDPKAPATRVTLENGQKGFVQTAALRSLLDYRLIAEPKDGVWKITAFIAGD